jgi:subtilisin family serine protease
MKTTPLISSSFRSLSLLLAAALAVLGSHTFAQRVDTGEVQLIVKMKPSMPEAVFKGRLNARGATQRSEIRGIAARVIRAPKASADLLKGELARDANIEYVEPDFIAQALGASNDPYFVQGSQWHLSKIQAPTAWGTTTGSSTQVVAVIDSGVRASHPDLVGKVLVGYDFVANDNDANDENGHGTGVAGTLSPGSNNLIGVCGVAWANPILPVRVLDANGSGNYSAIANGIIYAADRGAKVINLSLGGTSSSRALQDAINYAWNKQCVIVAAAGNNGSNVAFYPAACTNVVAVSATNASDTRPTWSNFGSYVDVSAPGVDILSVYGTDQYAAWNGTSFSSPIASGVVALMGAANSTLTNVQLVDLLIKNSDDIGALGKDVYYGSGRVNANRAVTAAKNFVPPVKKRR